MLESTPHDCEDRSVSLHAGRLRKFTHGLPYGPNVCRPSAAAMLEWVGKTEFGLGLRWVPDVHDLSWLISGRSKNPAKLLSFHGCDWRDHLTAWAVRGGPAVIVAQPYHVTDKDRRYLDALGVVFPQWRVTIDRRPSWYMHGAHYIEIARRDRLWWDCTSLADRRAVA